MNLETDKAALRKQALARRSLVSPEDRKAAAAHMAEEGLRLARARPGVKTAALYWPIRDEADTFPLIRALADAGFTTALPVLRGAGEPMAFRRWAPGDLLVKASFGLSEPEEGQPLVEPDIVFTPASLRLAGHPASGPRLPVQSWFAMRGPISPATGRKSIAGNSPVPLTQRNSNWR